ncbi:MAG: hypothetical protein JSV16_16710, partial [Candidatus Hydrogenedentota bacterium]
SPRIVELASTGHKDGTDRRVTVVAEVIRENVSPWNNAIFGGSGQVGGVINGNCAIHGSVHLLGEGVADGGTSMEALDLSGESLIHNNYEGMPALLSAKVPALPTTEFGGETISTLDAKLRVKNGAVGVSGESHIGEADIFGNAFKETMDRIYIETDYSATRWTGTAVVDGEPKPENVQSDNGTNALYDLGDEVQMPDLSAPYTDPGGTSWASYEEYYSANALHLPALTLDDSCAAGTAIQGHPFPAGVTVTTDGCQFTVTQGTNTITYNPSAAGGVASLAISGMIQVDGDLVVGKKNLDISYAGSGTIFAGGEPGNIDVHSDLLPTGTFPTTDVLGLMAKTDMNLATGPGDSELYMAAAFFAGVQITSLKQNQIAGAFVCDYFDMGTNIPKIYQVPALVDNLPPGLIGADPIWVTTGFQERSWRVD